MAEEPLWEKQPVLTSGKAIRLVAEVVSTNCQDDYAHKVEDYALLGIPDIGLWIFGVWAELPLSGSQNSRHSLFANWLTGNMLNNDIG